MSLWTSKEVAQALNVSTGDWQASGVSIDTRTLEQGDIFIALKGENSDGHQYVAQAIDKGAAAAIIDHVPEGVDKNKCLIVENTLKALGELGLASRARTGARVIGVTGSVGKTGTKDMLAHVFDDQCQTHAAQKSYNNHWGVPLTLSGMSSGTDVGIFEMGMNHAGEISPLSRMVRPDIAIITTVEAVHVGEFENGVEGIAHAKAEIFDGIEPGGSAILNRDNEWFDLLSEKASSKSCKIYSFGRDKEADARLDECLVAANGTRVRATILGEEVSFSLSVSGEHRAMNALSVLLSIKLLGYDLQKAAKALQSWVQKQDGRGKREVIGEDNPVTLLDESYNASPAAMKAAFKVMALIDPGRGGRRIAILGDMAELGDEAAQYHKDLALPLEAAGVQLVYTCGPMMKHLHNELPANRRGGHRDEPGELAEIVPDVIAPGDVVLVKGSRGGGEKPKMQVIVEALRSLPQKWKSGS